MGPRREELSTADLAGQPPESAERSDVTEEQADLGRDDRTDAADRTGDEVARDDLAPEDLARDDDVAREDLAAEDRAPEDRARDDLAGEPALTEGRSPDLAADVEPGEAPQPLRQDDGRDEGTATGTDPDLASSAAPAAQAAADAGTADTATKAGHLLAADDAEAFRARWTDVQHGFVDAPRQAVAQADGLVAELMQHLPKTFADERGRLRANGTRETTSPPRTCAPPSSATVCSSSDSSPPDRRQTSLLMPSSMAPASSPTPASPQVGSGPSSGRLHPDRLHDSTGLPGGLPPPRVLNGAGGFGDAWVSGSDTLQRRSTMVEVGDRILVESEKVGTVTRSGVVTAVDRAPAFCEFVGLVRWRGITERRHGRRDHAATTVP